jgi:hypothetical protein
MNQATILLSKIHMDQMILPEPSSIIILTYQDMMEWISRILVGEMTGNGEDLGWEVGQMWLIFFDKPTANPNSAKSTWTK